MVLQSSIGFQHIHLTTFGKQFATICPLLLGCYVQQCSMEKIPFCEEVLSNGRLKNIP